MLYRNARPLIDFIGFRNLLIYIKVIATSPDLSRFEDFLTEQISDGLVEKYDAGTSISGKLCGRNLTIPEYESASKDMSVIMHSDVNEQDRGFKASYEASLVKDTGLFYFYHEPEVKL